ncbi:MAG: hypothetical protein HXX10_25850 [Rhodoplanes sp.]|uniref:hypothetical protein n=1 Tax=Rhodoplanes sp. TaxID=1968906 RepID=UPI001830180F|nr:hypothetical protein [Rhodoplanes sp.]NVO17465.1 hypothetical protein [Rhodoplanes sp.]
MQETLSSLTVEDPAPRHAMAPPRRGPPIEDPGPGATDPGPIDDPEADEDEPGPIEDPAPGHDQPPDIDDPTTRPEEPTLQVSALRGAAVD